MVDLLAMAHISTHIDKDITFISIGYKQEIQIRETGLKIHDILPDVQNVDLKKKIQISYTFFMFSVLCLDHPLTNREVYW